MNISLQAQTGAFKSYSQRRLLPLAAGSLLDLGVVKLDRAYGLDDPFAEFLTKQFSVRFADCDQAQTAIFEVTLNSTGTGGVWLEVLPTVATNAALSYCIDICDGGGNGSACMIRIRRKTTTASTTRFDTEVRVSGHAMEFFSTEIDQGQSAHWPFEEASGDRVDVVGGLHLVNHGATQVAGVVGNAVHTTASSSQYLEILTTAAIEGVLGQPFFISCHVKLDSMPGFGWVYAKLLDDGTPSNYEYGLLIHNADKRFKFVASDGLNIYAPESNAYGDLPLGTWLTVFCWYDPQYAELGIKIFDNANPYASDAVTMPSGIKPTGIPLQIGSNVNSPSVPEYMDGAVDEFMIFRRILTLDEQYRISLRLPNMFTAVSGIYRPTVGIESTGNRVTTLIGADDQHYPSALAVKNYSDSRGQGGGQAFPSFLEDVDDLPALPFFNQKNFASALTPYTTTIAAVGGSLTPGTCLGWYWEFGPLCYVVIDCFISNTGTASLALKVQLPFTAWAAIHQALQADDFTTGTLQRTKIVQNTTDCYVIRYDGVFAGYVNGSEIHVQGWFVKA